MKVPRSVVDFVIGSVVLVVCIASMLVWGHPSVHSEARNAERRIDFAKITVPPGYGVVCINHVIAMPGVNAGFFCHVAATDAPLPSSMILACAAGDDAVALTVCASETVDPPPINFWIHTWRP